MSGGDIRVVFDCMVFLQGAGSRSGPARRCLELVDSGQLMLCLSPPILLELADVLARPVIHQKFPSLKSEEAESLLRAVRAKGELFTDVPNVFTLPRDKDDEIYIDLAIAANAPYLVTWNVRHLSYLMCGDTPEGQQFRRQFPDLTILDPVTFLRAIEQAQAAQ